MAKEQFNLRLEGELIQSIQEAARSENKTATQFITEALHVALGREIKLQPLTTSSEEIKQLIALECAKWAEPFNSRVEIIQQDNKEQVQELKSFINSVKANTLYYAGKIETELLLKIVRLEEAVKNLEKPVKSSQQKSIEINGEPKPKSWRLSQLADRWGVDEKLIVQHKLEKNFTNWSKQVDPDGIGWRLERGKFLPDQPLSVEEQPLEVLSGDSLVIA